MLKSSVINTLKASLLVTTAVCLSGCGDVTNSTLESPFLTSSTTSTSGTTSSSTTTSPSTTHQGQTILHNGVVTPATVTLQGDTLTINEDMTKVPTTLAGTTSIYQSTNGTSQALVSNTLTNAKFGYGVDGLGATAFHVGDRTDASQLPSSVSARYNGTFLGSQRSYAAGQSGNVKGTSAIDANFNTGTVTGDISDMQLTDADGVTKAIGYGIGLHGDISGNSYSGSATAEGTTSALGTSDGTMEGAFYGANAAETAGSVVVNGPNGTILGGFGGVKK